MHNFLNRWSLNWKYSDWLFLYVLPQYGAKANTSSSGPKQSKWHDKQFYYVWLFNGLLSCGVQTLFQAQPAWPQSSFSTCPKQSSLQRHCFTLPSQKHLFCVTSQEAPVVSSTSQPFSSRKWHKTSGTHCLDETSHAQWSWVRKAIHSLAEPCKAQGPFAERASPGQSSEMASNQVVMARTLISKCAGFTERLKEQLL